MKKINNILTICLSILGIIFMIKYAINKDLSRVIISATLPLLLYIPNIIKINEHLKFIYIIYLFLLLVLGCIFKLYEKIYFYDSIAHFIFGFAGSIIALYILKKSKKYDRKSLIFNIFYILILTLAASALWEIFEFINSIIFNLDVQHVKETGVNDTMEDIILAFLGSILFSIWYCYVIKSNKQYDKYLQ